MNLKELQAELHEKNPSGWLAVKRDIAHQVGVMLEEARIIRCLTQKELATLVGSPQPTLARIESGSRIPSLPYLNKMAIALDTYLEPPKFAFMSDHFSLNTSDTFSLPKEELQASSPYVSSHFSGTNMESLYTTSVK